MTAKKLPGPASSGGKPGRKTVSCDHPINLADADNLDPDLLSPAELKRVPTESLAAGIGAAHKLAHTAAAEAVAQAARAGRLLLVAKVRLKHGEWLPWLKKCCPFTPRTAQRYICAAHLRSHALLKSDIVSPMTDSDTTSIRRVLATLATPALPLADDQTPKPSTTTATDKAPRLSDPAQRAVFDAPPRTRQAVTERAVEIALKRDQDAKTVTAGDAKQATDEVLLTRAIEEQSDSIGITPEKLREAVAARCQFDDVLKVVRSCRNAVMELCKSPLAAFVGVQDVEIELANVIRQLKHGKPYCACVYCVRASGVRNGCKRCHQLGWLSEGALKMAPAEFRENVSLFDKDGKTE